MAQTFEEICPKWSKIINEMIVREDEMPRATRSKGAPNKTNFDKRFQELEELLDVDMGDSTFCVIGEAYGFNREYVYNCKDCRGYAYECDNNFCIPKYWKELIPIFVKHWNEKHR